MAAVTATTLAQSDSMHPQGLSLEQVYVEHVDFVWHVLRACGVRDADLDDLTHEVFLVVQRKLAEFEGRSKITTWLFSIAERIAKDYRNSARVRREQVMRTPPEPTTNVNGESEYEDARARQMLDELLDELPQPQRVVFVLFEIDGYAADEIATLIEAPVNTVYSRLRLARRQFEKVAARLRARGVR